jgi:hypothetical protein
VQKLLDFDVAIEPLRDGYRIRVVSRAAGEASTDFALPFTDKDIKILVLEVGRSIGRVRRNVRRFGSQERQLLETFGGQLFQAAFSGPVRECLGRSRLAADSKGAGLRIRLRLPPALANIPWEYLYDGEYGGFISLSPETALVRYVEMPAPMKAFPISPPLRILAMISAPSDIPELQGDEEWDKLNDALGDLARRGMVQVDRLEAGTLSALQRPLRLSEYHVLHFVGHGRYDEDAQDGVLALEGADRKTRQVTGRDLGMMLRGHRSLRLVVLNACEGARSARDDPFGGVAQALVRQGIPAVIAMQFEISDLAALVFSQSFYQAIGDGLPVDVAMVDARRAMFAEGNEVEWATPVLYMRSPDGRVFRRSLDAERKARVATPSARAASQRGTDTAHQAPFAANAAARIRPDVNGSEVSPYFFLSCVRADYDDDESLKRFFDNLCKTVAAEVGRNEDDVAFRDITNIGLGGEWAPRLIHALSTCQCFVPVLTPRLINSSFCGYEWQAFQNRLNTAQPPASGRPSRLLPILWRPFDLESSPQVIKDHQYKHGAFGPTYASGGLVMLAQQKKFEDDYRDFLLKFARMMKEAVKSAPLPPFTGPLDRDAIPNAFEST